MTSTPNHPAQRLAHVLRAENAALAAHDAPAAAALLPEKRAAAEALRATLPGTTPTPDLVAALRALVAENTERLALAIEVQGRILEMVARAARAATQPDTRYGRHGLAAATTPAQALEVRA